MLMDVAKKVKGGKRAIVVVLITELLISCAGLFLIWDVLSSHSSTGTLVFLFLPGYQIITAGVGSAIAGVLSP
jgi:hypothetical protein